MKIACDFDLWPIEKVTPYHANIKKHPESQITQLASMIAEYGWDQPIVVDRHGVIIKGHGRLEAAKKLGLAEVPIIVRSDLTPAQIKAARIADNKVAESDWDLDNLRLEIDELKSLDFDLDLTGFDEVSFIALQEKQDGQEGGEGAGSGGPGAENYTRKIEAPIYEPTGPKPALTDLFDTSRYDQLVAEINASLLPEAEKSFLRKAAARHIVFNYEKVAEYYAHSEAPVQELMEDSALVIIDFDQAIEKGFVVMTKGLAELYGVQEANVVAEGSEGEDDE